MKATKVIAIALILIAGGILFSGAALAQTNPKPLSTAQKLADFELLYQELAACYPYFGVNERVHGVNWLANYNKYRATIAQAKTDKDFYAAITAILNDLNNDHTDALPTSMYPYFYDAYKAYAEVYSTIAPFIQELEKTDTLKTQYWAAIEEAILADEKSDWPTADEAPQDTLPNVTVHYFPDSAIAMIKIRSFSYDLLEDDLPTLEKFFLSIENYEHLIIDIQGNSGGATDYWSDHVMPYLISETLAYTSYYAFRKTDKLKKFKPDYFDEMVALKDISLPNIPAEALTNEWGYTLGGQEIYPKGEMNKFKGRLYLVVDKVVYSSAETMAVMFKATGIGLVVGEKTGGDGIGTDPLLLTLPHSGIVIRYTGEMGLNPDGSANEETQTTPDLSFGVATEKERIQRLMKLIYQKRI